MQLFSELHWGAKMSFKNSIVKAVVSSDTTAGRIFDLSIQSLIVVSVVSFSYETLPDLSATELLVLKWMEIVTVGIFSVEYAIRLYAAEDGKINWMLSPAAIIDLVAIIPFYLSIGVDLRSIRMFRLLRIFRVLKIAKYNSAITRMVSAFDSIRSELALYLVVTCMVLWMSAVGIYYCERDAQPEVFASVFHSLWWSLSTLTTVGYGDVYPVTVGGKLFTFIVLMLGLSIVAVPSGLIASALTTIKNRD